MSSLTIPIRFSEKGGVFVFNLIFRFYVILEGMEMQLLWGHEPIAESVTLFILGTSSLVGRHLTEQCPSVLFKKLDTLGVCVLTVSRFMNPQIPAATSQANKITRQAKNCGVDKQTR